MKNEDIKDGIARINGDDAHHIINVLRFKIGTKLIISNGKNQYIVTILDIENSSVILKIIEEYNQVVESPINITLYQGLPKSDKMDLIIQKCTEIGIKKIVPVETEFSTIKIKEKNIYNKINRWKKISLEASKQSGRSIVPDVLVPVGFKDALESLNEFDLCLIPYEKETNMRLKDVLKKNFDAKNICVFIGPEGGFSENEIMAAIEYGAIPVTLGPRILRTETAGIVTSSIILYELGDLG
ncbi:16S rRNA methyltransferase [Thermoanaerobacterium thermosaccharolyticum]|uniref:Ribosomal RNA small subunit methyltransferase E n=2 Tax=Thermoanaerobacterium thermosaccharolyticum TaxID=1517 RepID=L0IKQ9_THETR|nr:16S rRNA (uracil(1498)-N(3))-methyltransferase [Thermoanaerobacterium thermosaccharolyticum]TCW42018.1 16S rRNA (uracil1498-N3)-methyltransferase [Thermohydrogenium kirishiense]AGB18796.1 RNA methyltransferase, RsmE family [Thermoanaerobacterium thermosaccharolyticum M0795]AST56318.1 16S rRNA methyltransferase [Thermoanaerobacterium thermosaccharolyticum]KAA5806702.1 16S rRNA (uracil(1498)-N(3))-methyltransferase [Thermoanaerobacterium thermosaccharolyticum]MBE0069529.1 16S rRNA (uracil(149